MSLPIKAVERLFERLAATYGAAWSRAWDAVPIADVKSAWAHELSVYADRLEVLAWALENLPEYPPNVIQFKALCRGYPAPIARPLPAPQADPARVRAELAKLGNIRAGSGSAPRGDGRAWARAILERVAGGEKLSPTTVRFAREALAGAA